MKKLASINLGLPKGEVVRDPEMSDDSGAVFSVWICLFTSVVCVYRRFVVVIDVGVLKIPLSAEVVSLPAINEMVPS